MKEKIKIKYIEITDFNNNSYYLNLDNYQLGGYWCDTDAPIPMEIVTLLYEIANKLGYKP